jgi:hypothetical protein
MDSTQKRTITLGGRVFTLGYLPFKKNRIVVPAADFAWKAYRRSLPPELGGENQPLNVTAVDNTYLAVFEAVSHADPKVTRDEFDSWGLSLQELGKALMQVCLQTGVLTQAEKITTGEA